MTSTSTQTGRDNARRKLSPVGTGLGLIHEDVRTYRILPRPDATLVLADGQVLDRSRTVITFVSRTLEPMRGVHVFMRALPIILSRRPLA